MANKFYSALLGLLFLLFSQVALCQNIGIGITNPNPSAQLDISSSSRGLLIPRMSTGGIAAISSPARGLLVYDSVKNQVMVNMGSASSPNWQSTVAGSGWSLSGNSGTDPSTQFIGNTDSKPLNFRVNNTAVGKVDAGGNVFWGLRSGQATSSGYSNIAIGTDALRSANTYQLIAIGDSAMMNNTTANNMAIGTRSLFSNSTGSLNTGIGEMALTNNTTGNSNLALGFISMNGNTTGGSNTALGASSLPNNVTGNYNTAVGNEALFLNNGNYNTAVGFQTIRSTTLSDFNTALGYAAGRDNDLGYNNVFLGANTGTDGAGYYNCIAIGQDVYCTNSNQVQIGNQATTVIGGWVGWSRFSDGRIKRDVSEDVKGLDFILRLRPVTYRYDMEAINRRRPAQHGQATTVAARSTPSENENRLFSGFIAQEVERASQQSGYDFAGVERPKKDNDLYTLRYDDFVVPLVKAMQEMNVKMELLQKENAALQQRVNALEGKK